MSLNDRLNAAMLRHSKATMRTAPREARNLFGRVDARAASEASWLIGLRFGLLVAERYPQGAADLASLLDAQSAPEGRAALELLVRDLVKP